MDVSDALAVIGATMPPEARDAQIQERRLNLAASATALALDLGVDGLPVEQRQATEDQVVRIAAEIERLGTVASVPLPDVPQAASLADRLATVEDALGVVLGEILGASE